MTTEAHSASRIEHLVLALLGLCAAVLLIISPWIVGQSGPDPYYKGPLIYPQLVLGIVAVTAIPSGLSYLKGPREPASWAWMPRRTFALFVLMCCYPAAIALAGFAAATFLAISAGLMIVGTGWRSAGLTATVATALLWLTFIALLDIWFPEPWLAQWTGG